jgi:hypothetical protein
VAVLEGHHHECIVAVNFVPETTISSNRFAHTFDGMQVFGYDIWRSKQMADLLLPGAHHSHERNSFVTARVMTTIATLMALTDGTQRLVLRLPADA